MASSHAASYPRPLREGAGLGRSPLPALLALLLPLAVVALAWGSLRSALLVLAAAVALVLAFCLLFRPYWYLQLLFVAVLSSSYTFMTGQAAAPALLDVLSPWRVRVGPLPIADLLVLLIFLRVVLDPRFSRDHRRHPFDLALAVFLLAYLPAAIVGMLHRNEIQTWTLWFFSVRGPVLFTATYLAASRLIPTDRRGPTLRFLAAPLLGLTLAVLGNAYRGFGLRQLVSRAGAPLLVFSEANMLPTMAALGLAYLATGRPSRPGRLLAWAGICFSLGVLLIGTRRSVLLFTVLSFLLLLFYLSSPFRRRAAGVLAITLAAALLAILVFTSLSGPRGRLWLAFIAREGWTQEGQGYRGQEIANVFANLDKYGGWVFGLGAGRRWERLLPQGNRFFRAGFGADTGHLWLYSIHVQFLRNLLEGGVYSVLMVLLSLALILRTTYQLARPALGGGEEEVLERNLLVGTLAGFLVTVIYLFAYPNVGIFAGALLAAMGSFALNRDRGEALPALS